MHQHIVDLTNWYLQNLSSGGYLMIIFLMALESSVVPIPSEFIIPPAAYLAARDHALSLPGVIIAGAIGSVLGAAIMYVASLLAGRPMIIKYGKYLGVSPAKVVLAEQWTAQYGGFGIFLSRFIPVIRHLIGIPAGIVRMDTAKYLLYTLLGAGIWCTVLAFVGVKAGQNPDLVSGDTKTVTIWVLGAVVILGSLYVGFVWRLMQKSKKG